MDFLGLQGVFQFPPSVTCSFFGKFKTWLSIFSSVSIPPLAAVFAPFWGLYLILNINKMASMYNVQCAAGAPQKGIPSALPF